VSIEKAGHFESPVQFELITASTARAWPRGRP
jgi:hypothetical protein